MRGWVFGGWVWVQNGERGRQSMSKTTTTRRWVSAVRFLGRWLETERETIKLITVTTYPL